MSFGKAFETICQEGVFNLATDSFNRSLSELAHALSQGRNQLTADFSVNYKQGEPNILPILKKPTVCEAWKLFIQSFGVGGLLHKYANDIMENIETIWNKDKISENIYKAFKISLYNSINKRFNTLEDFCYPFDFSDMSRYKEVISMMENIPFEVESIWKWTDNIKKHITMYPFILSQVHRTSKFGDFSFLTRIVLSASLYSQFSHISTLHHNLAIFVLEEYSDYISAEFRTKAGHTILGAYLGYFMKALNNKVKPVSSLEISNYEVIIELLIKSAKKQRALKKMLVMKDKNGNNIIDALVYENMSANPPILWQIQRPKILNVC